MNKKKLLAELEKINAAEEKAMIDKYYPILKKKYEGKYFKYKNCYSCPKKPSDYWWMYTRVTEIKREDVYDTRGNGVTAHYTGFSFQTDKDGNIRIDHKESGYVHRLQQEISANEFCEAFNKMSKSISQLPVL